jgi:hypothetical protein
MKSRRRSARIDPERPLTVTAHGSSPAGRVEITLPLKRLDELDATARAAIRRHMAGLLVRLLRADLAARAAEHV